MKGYYLFAPDEPGNVGPESGVERKVRAQNRALNEYLPCELIILAPPTYKGTLAEKLIRRLPYTAAWRKWKYKGEFDDADFVYIRQVYHDQAFLRYLKQIRKHNPEIKLIYEVPTYPFESGGKVTWSKYPFSLKRRKSIQKIFDQMDRIVTFYGQDTIKGIPCIDLINGFDFSRVQLPERTKPDEIHILSVAVVASWHGYDRVLSGLAKYYARGGKEKIVYHYVGTPMPEHVSYAQEHGLGERVIFHGRQSGDALKAIYQQCMLGVDVLGGHRKNYPVSSSLKSREYCAYGIPMITSSPVDFLPKDSPFQLIVPYDDSPVDMEAVVQYYHSVYDGKDCNEVAKDIRDYAEARCDMSITMKPVADWLLKEES